MVAQLAHLAQMAPKVTPHVSVFKLHNPPGLTLDRERAETHPGGFEESNADFLGLGAKALADIAAKDAEG